MPGTTPVPGIGASEGSGPRWEFAAGFPPERHMAGACPGDTVACFQDGAMCMALLDD